MILELLKGITDVIPNMPQSLMVVVPEKIFREIGAQLAKDSKNLDGSEYAILKATAMDEISVTVNGKTIHIKPKL